MRLVIDLPAGISPAVLCEVEQLCALSHHVIVAVCNQFSGAIESTRAALGHLPVQVLDYSLPAVAANQPWLARACEPLREHFLACLKPDLVYIPELFARADVVVAIDGNSAWPTVVRLGSGAQALTPRQQAILARASHCLDAQENLGAYLNTNLADPQASAPIDSAAAATPTASTATAKRPRLAYISPLPPEQSGIADYSADLVPHLNQYYQVELILAQAQINAPWIESHIPMHSVAWFRQHASQFDRVLYHMGNSPMHQHMFELFEQYPGILVLHDFFLGNVLEYLQSSDALAGCFERMLYQAHGWSALLDQQQTGMAQSRWKYPCNKTMLDSADGVIVHSNFPAKLAQQWYGEDATHHWRVIPLLRCLPPGPTALAPPATQDAATQEATTQEQTMTQQAREHLGLAAGQFIVCSFGMIGRTKFNDRLLDAWEASPLAQDPQCELIFVGANEPGEYGQALAARLRGRAKVRITGFVSAQDYQYWLQAADAAVQLRTQGRGETSAAVLDCLLHGLPTIVNAHGANIELPDDVLIKLDDACPLPALTQALLDLRQQAGLREQLRNRARAYMQAAHAPEPVALQYRDAIEQFARHGRNRPYRQLLNALDNLSSLSSPSEADYLACAAAIANNQACQVVPGQLQQCFIDISAMVQTDLKTGIQRVVRSIVMALLQQTPAGFRIEPVFTRGGNQPYHYACQYMAKQCGVSQFAVPDTPIQARPGDIFIGLDLFIQGTTQSQARLLALRDLGVRVHFIVYDILPLLRPDAFPTGSETDFGAWVQTVASVSDGLLCISKAVAAEVQTWLVANPLPIPRQRPLSIGYFHLGADIDASNPSTGMPESAPATLQALSQRRSLLMVGTVEPRKGHAQALAAFELLWQQGIDINLVIVGKHGWMVDALAQRLNSHPELGKRLFWLAGISDEMLLAVYQASTALLAASEAEGFGLPLIEAAQHHLPIIARGIPVFKEVSGAYAFYFDGLQAQDLAKAVRAWLSLFEAGRAPSSEHLPWLTWQQSAAQLKAAIWDGKWLTEVAPEQTCAGAIANT